MTVVFFLVLVTIFLIGIGNCLVPLMVGARGMAFPRLDSPGPWLIPVSILICPSALLFGGPLSAGWTDHPPLGEVQAWAFGGSRSSSGRRCLPRS